MANTITLAKNYTDLLDLKYKNEIVTSDLVSDNSLIRAGASANEIVYPQITVTGLGDYDRNAGYTNGAVNLAWKTSKFNYDRGTKIAVDVMDNQETFDITFGMAAGELMRTQVAPEADAFTFATLAALSGISKATAATYATGEDFLKALITACNVMDEDEVSQESRLLYATPTLINSLMALDTYKSREVLNRFSKIVKVPQARFYTAIDLYDGKTDNTGSSGADERIGGYKKNTGGKDINFMIVEKSAIIKWDKHVASNVISPENNPDSDAYILKYRKYGIVDAYENKRSGIYLSHKA